MGLLGAVLLLMIDLTRHILLDAGLLISTLHMFAADGSLTLAGKLGMWSTWIGDAILLGSLIWYVLPAKKAVLHRHFPAI